MGERVPREFFERPTLEMAEALLGTELVHETGEGTAAGRIVEVEAYIGPGDKAAHTYGGRRTRRTEAMFGPAGHAYVYQIRGTHFCLNAVSGANGSPEAVLIRALEPTRGLDLMAARRGLLLKRREDGSYGIRDLRGLAGGPGRLCRALGITKEQYGWSLTDSPLHLCHDIDPIPADQICRGPRVNIEYAEEAREWPWRFWIRGNPYVSKKG